MIVLDTHNLAIDSVVVSTFSTWEIAMLVARGKLQFAIDLGEWITQGEQIPGFTFQPVGIKPP
jgi:PIN domain nuclease of toxin-antitoxin system